MKKQLADKKEELFKAGEYERTDRMIWSAGYAACLTVVNGIADPLAIALRQLLENPHSATTRSNAILALKNYEEKK